MTPLSNRLIEDDDSPLGEKILDISEAQAEAMVNPHRLADDLRREPIAGVSRPSPLHGTSLSVSFAS